MPDEEPPEPPEPLNYAEVYTGDDGVWYWRLRAFDGDAVVVLGPGSSSEDLAVQGVKQTYGSELEIHYLGDIQDSEKGGFITEFQMPSVDSEDIIEG
jgi:hypothetical protein